MHEEIYIESDEEVTSVIDKIKKSTKNQIALFLPRNAVLGQSVVNLKLVYKEAAMSGKKLALVAADMTTQRLAERVGFLVFDSAKQVAFAASDTPKASGKTANKEVKAKPLEESKDTKPEPKVESKPEEKPIQRKLDNIKPMSAVAAATVADETVAESLPPEASAAGFVSQSVDNQIEPDELKEKEVDQAVSKDTHEAEKSEPDPTPPTQTSNSANGGSMIPTSGNLRFFRQQKKRATRLPFLVGVACIIAGLLLGIFLLPSATVKITVKAQPFEATVKSNVETEVKEVDVEKATIPGRLIAAERVSKSAAKATGKKDLGTKAKGEVTVYNEWDSVAHTYAAGTKIRAKNGNEFIFTDDVTVPGASSSIVGGKAVIKPGKTDAPVEAIAPGDGYNNAPTSFTIPSLPAAQQEKIYATSSQAFSGGTTNIATVITESDLTTLTNNVKAQNTTDAIDEIKKQAGDDVVIDKAIQTVAQESVSSGNVGDQAQTVEVTVTGTFNLIVFTKAHQQQLLEKLLANKIPEGQQLITQGEGTAPDTSNYELNLVSDKKLELTNNLKAFTAQKFDPNVVRRTLIFSQLDEMKTIVSRSVPVENVEATITPGFWPRMPLMSSKIKLDFIYQNKENP